MVLEDKQTLDMATPFAAYNGHVLTALCGFGQSAVRTLATAGGMATGGTIVGVGILWLHPQLTALIVDTVRGRWWVGGDALM